MFELSGELLYSIRNTLNYFANSRPNVQIGRIILTGGGARLRGIVAVLGEMTRTPVDFGNPFDEGGTLARDIRHRIRPWQRRWPSRSGSHWGADHEQAEERARTRHRRCSSRRPASARGSPGGPETAAAIRYLVYGVVAAIGVAALGVVYAFGASIASQAALVSEQERTDELLEEQEDFALAPGQPLLRSTAIIKARRAGAWRLRSTGTHTSRKSRRRCPRE